LIDEPVRIENFWVLEKSFVVVNVVDAAGDDGALGNRVFA